MALKNSNWDLFRPLKKQAFMGVDCSSWAIHAVLIDDNECLLAQCKWRSSDADFNVRFLQISQKFGEDLSKINIIVKGSAVESAIFIQNPKSTMEIATVVGGVRLICFQQELDCTPVDNRHWKKVVLGKGNLNKQAIKEFAVAKWGDVFKEQDWADAACIALWIKRRQENG